MRRFRRLLFLVAIIAAAFWWFDLRQGDHVGLKTTDTIVAPQNGSDLEGADQPSSSDWATLENTQTTVGPPQDVTDAQREELIAYLHERWPHIMTDYGFTGVRRASWDPEDGGYIGYLVEFAADTQTGTQRHQEPVIGCGFSVRHSSWHCISPVLEPADAFQEHETED